MSVKKPTEAEKKGLLRECPRCRAKAEQWCKNYAGRRMAMCDDRLGAASPRHRQSAEKKTAKEKGELGPLFADQAEGRTAEQEYWHWRRNKAGDNDFDGGQLLEEFRYWHLLRRVARDLVGEPAFSELDAYCHRVYPSCMYWVAFWRKVLTGQPAVRGYNRVPVDEAFRKAHPLCGEFRLEEVVYQQAHMTAGEFEAMWKAPGPPLGGHAA